ncbi:MAG: flagellar basal body rod protein FlgB [Rhodoferax sp.]|uniref:flagellar basal body rod protein FlgB n=1 Tax=Rhodoferax sp. TaxID=50421 RepID=UPI002629BF34|nr:flagellar basal body rod protein FlgB [Rhodoferax sp.]MDD2880941.1 flagellar basal body rod protein FlgB [Rhodoferax sp.]
MFAQFTSGLDIHAKALVLRAERQRIIASNIANADTPGYVARDINFKEALTQMTGAGGSELSKVSLQTSASSSPSTTNARHMALSGLSQSQLSGSELGYTVQSQPSADGNSVDLDRERASFVDNSVHYESTLRFINGQSKTILSAIQGQ